MNVDLALLSLFRDRPSFFRYKDLVSNDTLSDETRWITGQYDKYFAQYPDVVKVEGEEFLTFISHVSAPNMDKDRHETVTNIINRVVNYDNKLLLKDILEAYRLKELALDISDCANRVIDGESDVVSADFTDLVKEFDADVGKIDEDDTSLSSDLFELVAQRETDPGYSWKLDCLNRGCGPVRGGDLIEVFGRPNSGKTSFVVSETSFIAPQLDNNRTIVWFNNEESGNKIIRRYYSSVLGKPWNEIEHSAEDVLKKYAEKFDSECLDKDRLLMYDVPVARVHEIESILADVNPGVIVFNNLDKVHGFKNDGNEAQRLARLYQWARELAKEHNSVVFAIGQAGADAEQRKKLRMDDMDNSKTGKAGEADLIVGIGYNDAEPGSRYISTPKNKLDGGGGNRDVFAAVEFNGELARYDNEVVETYGQ